MQTTDFLVIGGGIIGLGVALELRKRFGDATITVLEKESDCGAHASGRNSGVLHAGFYYSADSLKARFTRDGNRQLTDYCVERKLRINRCGKIVVARTAADLDGLRELMRRGRANGVEVHEITARDAADLEPLARTVDLALWSPTTSSVEPREVLATMADDARSQRVRLLTGVRYLRRRGKIVRTSAGDIQAGYVVNAAGLYADRIAQDFGFASHYRVLPFKGIYLYQTGEFPLRRHLYPVPNLANPFLGVHFTLTVDGRAKIGPTAIPAFWREQYGWIGGFRTREFADILMRQSMLLARDSFGFRSLAFSELRKYRRRTLVSLAAELAPSAQPEAFRRWGKPGIRAQLFDMRSQTLEMDFKYEGDERSFHILNAVSPGFTCAFPFASHVVGEIAGLVR